MACFKWLGETYSEFRGWDLVPNAIIDLNEVEWTDDAMRQDFFETLRGNAFFQEVVSEASSDTLETVDGVRAELDDLGVTYDKRWALPKLIQARNEALS